jgi:hypothetical protein
MFLGSTYFKYVFVFIVLSYFVRIIYDVHVLQLFLYLHHFFKFALPQIFSVLRHYVREEDRLPAAKRCKYFCVVEAILCLAQLHVYIISRVCHIW